MRPLATAAILAAVCLTATLHLPAQSSTTTHRPVTGANAHRRTGPAISAKAGAGASGSNEGLAAMGTMPAAVGPSKPLYTLRYVDLVTGTGDLAKPRQYYTVQYTGWTTDGKKFDSSYDHGGDPFTFPVGARRVIIGWDTGFEGMRVGGKRRLIVPYQLAYGEAGHPPEIPAKSDLIFDIELVSQSDPSAPPAQPPASPQPSAPTQPPAGARPVPQPGTNPVTNPTSPTGDPKDQTNKTADHPDTQPK